MSRGLKLFIFLLIFGLCFFIGNHFYSYFTYQSIPDIHLLGLERNGAYRGIIHGGIQADNYYKIAEVSVAVDGQPLEEASHKYLGKAVFSLPFDVDTRSLEDGPHMFELFANDASYHRNSMKKVVPFIVDNTPLKVAFLDSEYSVMQGRTLHVKLQTNKEGSTALVKFLTKTYECFPQSMSSTVYECFIPIGCEESGGEYQLLAEVRDAVGNKVPVAARVNIIPSDFPKSKGIHISESKLEEEKEISMSTKILEEALEKWLKDSPNQKLWAGPFGAPTNVLRVSTPFGEIRTTPHKGRYLHKAVDLVNTPKSVVWASEKGKVIIKDRYFFSGNTVVIDHGCKVFTLYFHLDSFADIEVGDIVSKGNPIGKLGGTGYANAPHLHWELRVNNVAVDPFQWTKKTF